MEPNQRKKTEPKTIVIAVILVAVFISVVTFCNNLGKRSDSSPETTTTSKFVASGDRGYINVNTYAALTKDDFDLMIDYMNAKNEDGLAEMMVAGKVFSIKKDTEVNVVDKGLAKVKVSYTDGSGWVPIEYVTKK